MRQKESTAASWLDGDARYTRTGVRPHFSTWQVAKFAIGVFAAAAALYALNFAFWGALARLCGF